MDRIGAIVRRGEVMRLVSRSGLIATALAVSAIAAPSAEAGGLLSGLAPDPPGAAQQEAQSFLRIYSHPALTAWEVRPNPDEQLPASTPAVATPDQAAVARALESQSAALDRIAQANGRNITPTATTAVSTGAHMICTPRSPSCLTVSNTSATTGKPSVGFHYDDAAVGAGVIAGLVLLGTAGTFAMRRRGQLHHS
jgi:hypothetical protein